MLNCAGAEDSTSNKSHSPASHSLSLEFVCSSGCDVETDVETDVEVEDVETGNDTSVGVCINCSWSTRVGNTVCSSLVCRRRDM